MGARGTPHKTSIYIMGAVYDLARELDQLQVFWGEFPAGYGHGLHDTDGLGKQFGS